MEETIIQILIRRDGMTPLEANEFYQDCLDELYDSMDDMGYEEVVDWIAENFGLEPDYMDEILMDLNRR